MTNRELMYSKESEKAILAAFITEPHYYSQISIQDTDFYVVSNKIIFRAIKEIIQDHGLPDYIALCEKLESKNQLTEIGGEPYITGLLSSDYFTYNVAYHAETVKEKAKRRRLVAIANEIVKSSFDEDTKPEEFLPGIINSLVDTAAVSDGAKEFSYYLKKLELETLEKMANPQEVWGIPTGFPTIDKVTGGLQKGEFWLLSGKPGVGKSMFAMQMAAAMAKSKPGVIYSIEMSGIAVARRLVSGFGKVPTRNIKTGRMNSEDFDAFSKSLSDLQTSNLFLSDAAVWTTTAMRADLARMKALHGVEWFLVDYMYLLSDGMGSDEIERTSLASKGLKRICRDLNMGGVVIHSLNKAGMDEDVIPSQENLRGSGQVTYDPDLIAFIGPYNRKLDPNCGIISPQQDKNIRTFYFAKGRELEDAAKFINFFKSPDYPFFSELSYETTRREIK